MNEQKPAVGRVVHYVGYGTPKGEYGQECRAAIITEVIDATKVMLFIMNPKGVFFTESTLDPEEKKGGTWHWPERV
jgi:hypothetical protein